MLRPFPVLKTIVLLGWIATAILGFDGYFSQHPFLTVSLWQDGFSDTFSLMLGILLFLLPAISLFVKRPWNGILVITAFIVWLISCSGDINRLQSYMLVYLLVFLVMTSQKKEQIQATIILLLAGIYLYGGVHKINLEFAETVGKGFWFYMLPIDYSPTWGYAFAILEALLGIGLLWSRTRKVSCVLLIIMHLIILWKIGPLKADWNYVVWPWNVMMVSLLITIFMAESVLILKNQRQYSLYLVILLVWLLPALNFMDWYPDTLSWHLYTGNDRDGQIVIDPKDLTDKEIALYTDYDKHPDKEDVFFQITEYSVKTRGISIYSDEWVVRRIYRQFCKASKGCKRLELIHERR